MILKRILPLIIAALLVYLPIIVNPAFFLDKHNDLQEFFWPIYFIVKKSILEGNGLPLWNNLLLAGTPLLPDPQAPLFYIPNIIFLFLPLNLAFFVSSLLHTLAGSIGIYVVSLKKFKFSKEASIAAGIFYIFLIRTPAYIEAGHFGLILSTAWIPLVILSTINIVTKKIFTWSIILAISLSSIYFTHSTTFIFTSIFICPLLLFLVIQKKEAQNKTTIKIFLSFLVGIALTLGLISISFLPQIEWLPQTSRTYLKQNIQVWPIWESKLEYATSILVPWVNEANKLKKLDTEKWLLIGLTILTLSTIGFFKLKKGIKLTLLLSFCFIFLISSNNLSPIYNFLLTQDWFVYARVATRIWFAAAIIVVFLASYGLDKIQNRKLKNFLILLALTELLLTSWVKITKPAKIEKDYLPKEGLEFLSSEKDIFRTYCISRCISQKDAALYSIELVDGYSTLIQTNFFKQAWQLTGLYWNYYTLAIPPIGSDLINNPRPDVISLGKYNTKYILSPYELNDKNLEFIKKINNILIYKNNAYLPRAYLNDGTQAKITKYSNNKIEISLPQTTANQLIISNIYSSGWNAYDNNGKIAILETPIALQAVNINPDINHITLAYEPKYFKIGFYITGSTVILIMIYFIYIYKKTKR